MKKWMGDFSPKIVKIWKFQEKFSFRFGLFDPTEDNLARLIDSQL